MLKTFVFIDVGFVKQENLKMKTKKDLREQGFELQIFSNFPSHDLNFHWK